MVHQTITTKFVKNKCANPGHISLDIFTKFNILFFTLR